MSHIALRVQNNRSKKHETSKRSNHTIFFGILFLIIIIRTIIFIIYTFWKWLDNTSHFPLCKLVITGNIHYTTYNDIQQLISAFNFPQTFVSQNIKNIQQQINILPWIKNVIARKIWHDTLKITILKFVPVATWNHN